ncbi:MAG: GNAT family N-acetyltransferase [Cyanobacteriota bacterium]
MQEDNLFIKKAELCDAETICELGKITFYQTFYHEESEEDMENYLSSSFSLEKIESELNDKKSVFFIVYFLDKPVGYSKINFEKKPHEIELESCSELQRIYILNDFQGKNIARKLLYESIRAIKEKNFKYVWLGVSDRNVRAISFYKKYGFDTFGQHIFKLGKNDQIDIVMKKEL